MPEYLTPGVYIEETATGSHPIDGVPTSTAGFVGAARFGAVDLASPAIASLADYERLYDPFGAGQPLAWADVGAAPNLQWRAVRAFFAEGGKRLSIARAFKPASAGDDGVARIDPSHLGGLLDLRARHPGAAGNLGLRIELQRPAGTLALSLRDPRSSATLMRWTDLAPGRRSARRRSIFDVFGADADDAPLRLTHTAARMPAAAAVLTALFGARPGRAPALDLQLTGGNDGLRPGAAELARALPCLEPIDDIALVAAPGLNWRHDSARDDIEQAMALLVAHADKMRYRIALLDAGDAHTSAAVSALRPRFDSSHAALFHPWLTVSDAAGGAAQGVPPSAFVAGLCARVDGERGVWKSPANEPLRGATGLLQPLSSGEQQALNAINVNTFRVLAGQGLRLWGWRTLSNDPAWRYLNLRRSVLFLQRSIERGLQWVVFEPNGDALWTAVRRAVDDFLRTQWQQGVLMGDRPGQAWFVRCDRSTMTQDDLDNGRLVCEIGIAPLRPAEFLILRIGQWTAEHKP